MGLVLLTLLALFWAPLLASDWMEQPYKDDSFNMRREYLDNATLTCEDGSDVMGRVQPYTVSHWIRPDMKVMGPGSSDSFLTIDGMAGYEVSGNGSLMHISLIQESQFGFYYCYVSVNGDVLYIKKALNYKGPLFDNLWDKYEMNVIIACSSVGGFWVLCIALYVIYRKLPGSDEIEVEPPTEEYDNLGYVAHAGGDEHEYNKLDTLSKEDKGQGESHYEEDMYEDTHI